jgi:hypothetical protein
MQLELVDSTPAAAGAMIHSMRKMQPTPALEELHKLDQEAGVDPLGPSRVVGPPPPPPPPAFRPDPPPWSVNYRPESDSQTPRLDALREQLREDREQQP